MSDKKSSFQKPITIKEVIANINKKKFLLPAIQREFVWDVDQIVSLFDSLMRGYPIGSFLFWEVEKDKIKSYQFYEFLREYHERDNTHNPKADVIGEKNITAILDGQQRLTALYIGLKGTYSYKESYKRWDNDNAYPKRKLYLNLLKKSDKFEQLYDFQFLTPGKAREKNENCYWFEVGKIVEFEDIPGIYDYLRNEDLITIKFASDCLCKLWEIVTQKEVINYYLETSQELEKVLNIFIRVNSGGTLLSYSDLLLSIATAEWDGRDAREEITSFVDELNKIPENFNFNKDFVLKSCLVLSDITDIAFKVDNFDKTNMKKIENSWDSIKKSLRLSVELISSYGYNRENLTSNNAVIPIAYYILKKGSPSNFVLSKDFQEDRLNIKKWFNLSLIKMVFSGQPDNVLRPIREIIQGNYEIFPLDKIIEKFKGTNKSIIFTKDDIEILLTYKYGKGHTFSALSLLYPTLDLRNRFHLDHIFPKSWFKIRNLKNHNIPEKLIKEYIEKVDLICNLQLLEGLPNEEKSNKDFKEWLKATCLSEEERIDFLRKHMIPTDESLEFSNFIKVMEKRNEKIKEKFKELLL